MTSSNAYGMHMPQWKKQGLIYSCESREFFKSHATRPVPVLLGDDRLRLYFSSRGSDDMPYPTYIDVDPNEPGNVLFVNEKPLLNLGRTGTFDDSGVTPVSILDEPGRSLMYYVGWKRRRYNVTIETSIGVAYVDHEKGTLQRVYEGPILAQDPVHPILVAAPFVVRDAEEYVMWYCSGTEWRQMEHGPEMLYTVFRATSPDGFSWKQSPSDPVIPYNFDGEVISAPWIVKTLDGWQMWYSTRGSRTPSEKNYLIGVAVSGDGTTWRRMDKIAAIGTSMTGWDSEMVCYPAIINIGGRTCMFYCGNGVGRGGIGYAVADRKLDILDWK
ncbi:hypothetical protein LSUCC0031_04970 [Rhodobacterales bacterium LSUCC0031]|nr:hypothetical protein [Rhodobacterales bacterium LSUCC0031]